ncbi:unnamed protein product [Pedinophyceae sp. YPF-701]|nr:unnamed protein product [Pedinophyceae sp. YPF-701]
MCLRLTELSTPPLCLTAPGVAFPRESLLSDRIDGSPGTLERAFAPVKHGIDFNTLLISRPCPPVFGPRGVVGAHTASTMYLLVLLLITLSASSRGVCAATRLETRPPRQSCWYGRVESWNPGEKCVRAAGPFPNATCPLGTWPTQVACCAPATGAFWQGCSPQPETRIGKLLRKKRAACRAEEAEWKREVCDNGSLNAFNWCQEGESSPARKVIALTFDDGPIVDMPWPYTDTYAVLDDLAAAGVTATFYISPGTWGGEDMLDAKCEALRAIRDAGHEIQSHTWTHRPIPDMYADGTLNKELIQVQRWVSKCLGTRARPIGQVRPPFGSITIPALKHINDLGLVVSMWSVDSDDWRVSLLVQSEGMSDADARHRIANRVLHGIDPVTLQDLTEHDPQLATLTKMVREGKSAVVLLHDHAYRPGVVQDIVHAVRAIDPLYQFTTAGVCYHGCGDVHCDQGSPAAAPCGEEACGWGV